jgi:hypothetical protein
MTPRESLALATSNAKRLALEDMPSVSPLSHCLYPLYIFTIRIDYQDGRHESSGVIAAYHISNLIQSYLILSHLIGLCISLSLSSAPLGVSSAPSYHAALQA